MLTAIYAILIRSYPTALLNGCLVGVNVYQLLRLRRTTGRCYEIQQISGGEGFMAWFLRQYGEDIRRFFADFEPETIQNKDGFAVFYENQAAGILLGDRSGGEFSILLDYTTPAYRDCSVGEYLYEKLPDYGLARLSCAADSPEHVQYMEKMGFARQADQRYVKELKQ